MTNALPLLLKIAWDLLIKQNRLIDKCLRAASALYRYCRWVFVAWLKWIAELGLCFCMDFRFWLEDAHKILRKWGMICFIVTWKNRTANA